MDVEIALWMGYCSNCGAERCLKRHRFHQAAVVLLGAVVAPRTGSWGLR